MKMCGRALAASVLFIVPQDARAATLDGAALTWPFVLPFAGLLLSIALGPLLFPKVWHAHYGKIAAAWSILTLASLGWFAGGAAMSAVFVHAMLAEYLSFIVLLFALYTVAGGILVTGDIRGTPCNNAIILGLGSVMASIVGTTGAAMILVRPLIRANISRPHNTHVMIFFIILVANVGGALSPLGDPPLFVGFLNGVDFFWTTQYLWRQTAIVGGLLLAIFCIIDVWRFRTEPVAQRTGNSSPIRIRGLINIALIAAIIAAILLSANWRPGIAIDILGTRLELQNLVRDGGLILIALLSLWLTPDEHREANGFTWEPIREVAKLFAAIFTAIIPVLAALDAGRRGFFTWLLAFVTERDGTPHEVAYFWYTGLMSAFLDNAPTYLLFFKLAGGDAQTLMGEFSGTLAAISMGAVFMGALTYIGNAPNFMVAAIAIERGVRMPSFFGYLLWASLILIPLFLLLTLRSRPFSGELERAIQLPWLVLEENKMLAAKSDVQVDTPEVRVTEWRLAPGSATGHHTHEMDYVIVPVTSGEMTIVAPNGERSKAQLGVGRSYFRKAGVQHDVLNETTSEIVFLEVELKP